MTCDQPGDLTFIILIILRSRLGSITLASPSFRWLFHPAMVVGHSTCKRSAAEYIAELRAFIEEHGRPPRNSSCLVGTDEYRLRSKVQYQMKKGVFSEAETRELDRLLKGGASAGALQTGDSASQQAWSAPAATALQTGAVSEVAAPMTPRDRLPSTLLSALGATASARARRYRGKKAASITCCRGGGTRQRGQAPAP